MRAYLSNTLIASPNIADGCVGPAGLSWNGAPILDVAQIFRAPFATVFGRGDGPEEFAFSSTWNFSTTGEALIFCSSHRTTLPVQADLTLVDDDGVTSVVMRGAVRDVRIGSVRGTSVQVDYKFTGSKFDLLEDVPEFSEDPDHMKVDVVDLNADDESVAIVFATPFGDVPRKPDLIIEAPFGQPAIGVVGVRDVTAAGFTAVFSAALPSSGYKGRWSAIL